MSDIRFEGWLHRSGTGGVYQDSAGNVGIASTQPKTRLDIQNGAFQIGPAGICTATTVNTTNLVNATALSNRNVIINGAAMVAQRGDTTSGSTTGGFATDRFECVMNESGTLTISQDSDAPSGFRKCHRLTQTTAQGSLSANDLTTFRYNAEGYDVQRFKKGTSDAEQFTVSFWVKSVDQSSYPVTYILELRDPVNTRSCCKAYTVTASNTWEYKTITFPADTTGQWATDTSKSLEMNWFVCGGSNYTSGTLSTTWAGTVTANRAAGLTANLSENTANRFFLTGVQLEVGSVATPFEHRSYGDELSRCQRYYQEISMSTMLMGSTNGSTQLGNVSIPLAVPMRSAPTIASGITYHMWHGDNGGANNDGTALVAASFSTSSNPSHSILLRGTLNGFSGRTDNRIAGACANSGTPIKLDAELS